MFNTHWIMIPISFFPAGISCGLLGITAEGILFITLFISICWLHIAFYFLCKVFLDIEFGQLPKMELLIALGSFMTGYLLSFGYQNFRSFCISLLAWGIFFFHDFVFGISLLFGGSTLKGILSRDMPPIRRTRRFYTKIKNDDS
ncbi:membrane hypothetical protein [Gammaproteobacteria bacterium]